MANESTEGKAPEGEEDRTKNMGEKGGGPGSDSGAGGSGKGEAPAEQGGPDRGSGGAALQRPPSDS